LNKNANNVQLPLTTLSFTARTSHHPTPEDSPVPGVHWNVREFKRGDAMTQTGGEGFKYCNTGI